MYLLCLHSQAEGNMHQVLPHPFLPVMVFDTSSLRLAQHLGMTPTFEDLRSRLLFFKFFFYATGTLKSS
jgi:hypothetical protein